ncbi:hypothetical protein EON82_23985, partial [bacterium]
MSDISFEFIQHPDLRLSLTSDYEEMLSCQRNACWKSVHILAGSIVEALLADDLVFVQPDDASVFKKGLDALIQDAHDKGLLSKRAVQLSSVVKDYRNLVHPGRMVRLKETIDEDGANTAVALTKMVIREVAKRRIETYGPTAEQVIAKINIDVENHAAHMHLVRSLRRQELMRLLCECIPAALQDLSVFDDQFDTEVAKAMQRVQNSMTYSLEEQERRQLAATYATLIREGSSYEIDKYERLFYSWTWLASADKADRALIVDHLHSRFVGSPDTHAFALNGLITYLDHWKLTQVMEQAAFCMDNNNASKEAREACRSFLVGPCRYVPAKRIEEMRRKFE